LVAAAAQGQPGSWPLPFLLCRAAAGQAASLLSPEALRRPLRLSALFILYTHPLKRIFRSGH
jgi:hypothetical protein